MDRRFVRAVGESAIVAVLVGMLFGVCVFAADPPPTAHQMQLPAECRQLFRNPDGSCVQCSNGMVGMHGNIAPLTLLLWDSPYGEGVHGGSSPSRVESYCRARGIKVFNVTGSNTWDWMKWAARTGRWAAIGAGTMHFQTLYGWDEATNTWYVCNNNSPQKVDTYTWEQFKQLHLASGQWVVIPDYPPMPRAPNYVNWWQP